MYMEKSVFDLLVDALAHERLDGLILQNPEYDATIEEVDSLAEELKAMDLGMEETKAVNRLICAYLTQNEVYSRFAYELGFLDAVELLLEIGMIRNGRKEGAA